MDQPGEASSLKEEPGSYCSKSYCSKCGSGKLTINSEKSGKSSKGKDCSSRCCSQAGRDCSSYSKKCPSNTEKDWCSNCGDSHCSNNSGCGSGKRLNCEKSRKNDTSSKDKGCTRQCCSQAGSNCSGNRKTCSSYSEKDCCSSCSDSSLSNNSGCGSERNSGDEELRSSNMASDSLGKGRLTCFSPVPSVIKSTSSLSSIQSFPEYKTDPNLSIADIQDSLSSHLKKRFKDFIKACRNFDTKARGKLSKSQLRQVLRTFCLPLTAAQFECLTQNLPQDEKGKVNYLDFFNGLGNFEEVYIEESASDEILTVDQIVIRLQNKFHPYLHDVVRSFWLFDYNKDGFVKKNDVKKIISNHCMKLSDQQFKELWKRYEAKDNGLLNYVDFLTKLGIHAERIKHHLPKYAPSDDPLWEEPCDKQSCKEMNYPDTRRRAILRKSDDPSVSGLTLDEIEKFFLSKLSKCGELLKRTLYIFDRQKDGQINIDDLHHALNCFVMPMSLGMFKDLFARLDVDVTPISRSVDIKEFLERFCHPDTEARKREFKEHLKSCGCEAIIEDIKNQVISPMEKLKTELKNMGKNNDCTITRREMRDVIEKGLEYPLSEKSFRTLIAFLDPGETNLICCGKFLGIFSCICDKETSKDYLKYCVSEYLGLAPASLGEKYKDLSGAKLLSKMKYHINKNRKSFNNAILACDPNNSKLITSTQLRAVLNNFCFPLTKAQFEELEKTFEYQGGRVEYESFLKIFQKQPGEDGAKWCRTVEKLSNFKTSGPKEVPLAEVEEILSDSIKAKHKKMLEDFRTLDPCKLGFCYKEDARAILNRYVMRMTDAQFEHLWRSFPLNQHHCLLYEKLVRSYLDPGFTNARSRNEEKTVRVALPLENESGGSAAKIPPSKADTEVTKVSEPVDPVRRSVAPASRMGSPPVVSKKDRGKKPMGDKDFQEEVFSKFPHLRKTCDSVRPQLMKHIRIIRQHIRRLDRKRTGIIHFENLRTVLENYGVKITEEDKYFILEYFDKDLTGRICYRDFMRLFVWYAQ